MLTGWSVTETEPEWDEDAREDMLALLADEAERCPGCGHAMSETTGPDVDPANRDATRRWDVASVLVCHACEAARAAVESPKLAHLKDRKAYLLLDRFDVGG